MTPFPVDGTDDEIREYFLERSGLTVWKWKRVGRRWQGAAYLTPPLADDAAIWRMLGAEWDALDGWALSRHRGCVWQIHLPHGVDVGEGVLFEPTLAVAQKHCDYLYRKTLLAAYQAAERAAHDAFMARPGWWSS